MRVPVRRSVRQLDAWLGRRPRARSTARACSTTRSSSSTSDHGENFGEGGPLAHAISVDDRLLRVPLAATGPGAEALDDMVSMRELPGRVAAAVGIDEHPWPGPPTEGLAIAQWDALLPPDAPQVSELARDWGVEPAWLDGLCTPLTTAAGDRFKLLRRGGAEELYDLQTDPLELAPLTDEGAMSARAGAELQRLRAALSDPDVRSESRAAGGTVTIDPIERADVERRMRLMGYL